MMNVINLFGPPGARKTTLAAKLFVAMRESGRNTELVTEYAKDLVFDGRITALADQLYVLAKQNSKLRRLQGKVDWAISDSPLPLCPFYLNENDETFTKLTIERFNSYSNINFWMDLPAKETYSEVGRRQTYEEACQVSIDLENFLKGVGVHYHKVGKDPLHFIMQHIIL